MAPKLNTAWNLGRLPNLHHHHHVVCVDHDPSEYPSTWRKEFEADLAQDRLVTAHDHRAGSGRLERMVGCISNVTLWFHALSHVLTH